MERRLGSPSANSTRGTRMRIAFAFAVVVAACTPTAKYGAFTLEKDDTEEAFDKVGTSASFELSCPREKLVLTVLDAYKGPDIGGSDTASKIGVVGCERRATYVRVGHSSWVMNALAEKDGSPATR